MQMMIEVGVNEFPFVQRLPEREKKRLHSCWDAWQQIKVLTMKKGHLVPSRFAAKLLGVSQPRIDELMDAGKLERVVLDEHPYITEESIVKYAQSERKTGRPPKGPKTLVDVAKAALECAHEKS